MRAISSAAALGLALLAVATASLLPSGGASAAAQRTEPTAACFEITVGWRLCAAPAERAPAQSRPTGCLPRELAQVARNDVAQLSLESCPLPSTTLAYGAPTTTGSVTDDGDYAFLTDPDDLTTMVTTYEGLRDGSTTGLVIHQSDSAGTSQADFYALVEAGDLMEWHQAADCFVRYTVTEVKDDPTGDPSRKLLAVAWMTYAFTGCSGAISSTATASLQFGPLPSLGGASLTAPIVHGMTQIIPEDWTGAIVEPDLRGDPSGPPPLVYTTDLATARTLPYWREPRLPDGWTFREAEGGYGSLTAPVFGYCADWRNADGYVAVEILRLLCQRPTGASSRGDDGSWRRRGRQDPCGGRASRVRGVRNR